MTNRANKETRIETELERNKSVKNWSKLRIHKHCSQQKIAHTANLLAFQSRGNLCAFFCFVLSNICDGILSLFLSLIMRLCTRRKMMLIFLASISSFVCLFKCQIDCVCVCVCARLQFFRFVRFSPVRTYQREFDYYYCVCMNDNCLSANICIRLSPLPISFALSHTLAVRVVVRVCLFVVPYHQIGAFFFIGFHSWNEVQCAKIFQRPVLKCKFLSQNYYLINSAPFITRKQKKTFPMKWLISITYFNLKINKAFRH